MEDPALVPIAFYLQLVEMDSQLLTPFLCLCKGFRDHLLFELKSRIADAATKFQKVYSGYFQLSSTYIWQQQITYANQHSTRVDCVFRFKVLKACGGKVCELGCAAKRYESTLKVFLAQTKFKFDCYGEGQPRW